MSWCSEPTPYAKNYGLCEGEVIFQFTYSYILFCIDVFFHKPWQRFTILEFSTSDKLLYNIIVAWETILFHPDKFYTG